MPQPSGWGVVSRAPQGHGSPERRLPCGRLWLVPGAALLAAVLTACDGGVTEPPFLPETSPTPAAIATPEATATVATGDLEGFRVFAGQVEAALEGRDVDFFMAIAEMSSMTCPSEFEPRCEGQPGGTVIEGIWHGRWRSEGTLLTSDSFRDEVTAYLDSLSHPTLYAVALLDRYVGGIIGGPAFFAVAASSDDLLTTTRVFEFVWQDGNWRMPLVMEAPVLAEEWLTGDCDDCYDDWERWEGTAP